MSLYGQNYTPLYSDIYHGLYALSETDALEFHAAYDVAGVFHPGVIRGIGDIIEARSGSIYLPDDSSPVVWQEYANTVPGEHYVGGKWWLHGQKALTNSQIRSFNLADGEWTKSNMTAVLDAPGMRGEANGTTTLTATAGNATCIANVITDASDDQTTRWHIKRKTGTGTINISVDGGSTWQDVTAEVDSTAGFNECLEDQVALANPQIGIRLVTDTDAVYVGNAEAFLGDLKEVVRQSGPIFTEAAAVSTNATELSFDIANHDNLQGGYCLEFRNAGLNAVNTAGLIGLNAIGRFLTTLNAVAFRSDDGPNAAVGPVVTLAANDVEYKIGLAYGSDLMRINTDGSWGTAVTYDGVWGPSSVIKVLANSSFTASPPVPCTMLIRNIRRVNLSYVATQAYIDTLMA